MAHYFDSREHEQYLGLWRTRNDIKSRDKLIGYCDEKSFSGSGVMAIIGNMTHVLGLHYSRTKIHIVVDLQHTVLIHLLEHIETFELYTVCNSCGKRADCLNPRCSFCRSSDVTYRGLRGPLFAWVSGLARLKLLDLLKREKRFDIFPAEENPREKWRSRLKEMCGDGRSFDPHHSNSMHEMMISFHERWDKISDAKLILDTIDRITSGEVSIGATHPAYIRIIARECGLHHTVVSKWLATFTKLAEV